MNYLISFIVLALLVYNIFFSLKKSNFVPTDIPDIPNQPNIRPISPNIPIIPSVSNTASNNVHLEDSRYIYPLSPPVNPIVAKTVLETRVEAPNYTPINNIVNTDYSLIDVPPVTDTNQLVYSGGTTQLLKIPLQMNEPNSFEQLRSQDVLITPYNRIKYSNNIC
jgi:hypothetical protein